MISTIAPIGLAELTTDAALMTRVDRKYLVCSDQLAQVVAAIAAADCDIAALEINGTRHFRYRSVNHDTPELTFYRQAALRRPRRAKVRTRTYLDSGQHWFEVKTRDARGRTVKDREPTATATVTADSTTFAVDVITRAGVPISEQVVLRPALCTEYVRSTLLLPASGVRVTIDTDLRWTAPDGSSVLLGDAVVVETKSRAGSSAADRAMWALGHRPVRFSKYATGMARLDARLPSTPWRPVLRHPVMQHPATPSAGGSDA